MSLLSWRTEHNISLARAADLLTAELRKSARRRPPVSPETIRRYELPPDHHAHRKPRRAEMLALLAITAGAVTPNDFYACDGSTNGAAGGEGVGPAGAAGENGAVVGAGRPTRASKRGRGGSAGRPLAVRVAAAKKAARTRAAQRKARAGGKGAR